MKKIDLPIINIIKGTFGNMRGKIPVEIEAVSSKYNMLLCNEDVVTYKVEIIGEIEAPIKSNTKVGKIIYYVNDQIVLIEDIVTADTVNEYNIQWCIKKVMSIFFL